MVLGVLPPHPFRIFKGAHAENSPALHKDVNILNVRCDARPYVLDIE